MMGIFGPDTRVINGLVYEKQGETSTQQEADGWASAYENKGYKSKVIPNVNKRSFEVWVAIAQDPRQKGD